MDALVTHVETGFVAVVSELGLKWGPTPFDLFFYRPPWLHIVEFVVFHLFCIFCHKLAPRFYHDNVTRKPLVGKPKSNFDAFLGVMYLVCWLSQLLLKAMRPNALIQLCWLFMPCHLITLLWAYIFLSKPQARNYHYCVYLASLATAFHWGPTSAAAFPDFEDHQYPIEGVMFIIHHGLLVLTPIYFAARYEILKLDFKFLCHLTMVATLINVGPYTLISYITGLNLNYHLYPPPKLVNTPVFSTIYYRFIVIAGLIVFSISFWTVTYLLAAIVRVTLKPFFGDISVAVKDDVQAAGKKAL